MTMQGRGDQAAGDGKAEQSMKQEGNWQQSQASECWSKCAGGASAADNSKMAAAQSSGDDKNWMEGRVNTRREEEAVKHGLDPGKASWNDVIEKRAADGSKDNEGRVERMREAEARALGLDPSSDWSKVNIARVQAVKAELEKKYGQK